jgi:hypothetical protein
MDEFVHAGTRVVEPGTGLPNPLLNGLKNRKKESGKKAG